MGFPENRKLAKDINKNTEDCTKQLETLLASINSQMGLMNSLISSISGGYVSKDYVDSAMPIGSILMWSGSVDTVPEKFHLCNGEEGTPDLRDRFIVGAGSDYEVGATGGSASTDLPSHTHTVTSRASDIGYHNDNVNVREWFAAGDYYPIITSSATKSGAATINTIPPYYALCFIMKIA
jgi:hypothetical protein